METYTLCSHLEPAIRWHECTLVLLQGGFLPDLILSHSNSVGNGGGGLGVLEEHDTVSHFFQSIYILERNKIHLFSHSTGSQISESACELADRLVLLLSHIVTLIKLQDVLAWKASLSNVTICVSKLCLPQTTFR